MEMYEQYVQWIDYVRHTHMHIHTMVQSLYSSILVVTRESPVFEYESFKKECVRLYVCTHFDLCVCWSVTRQQEVCRVVLIPPCVSRFTPF